MALVTAAFWLFGEWFVSFPTTDVAIRVSTVQSSRNMVSCYVFGIGIVLNNTFYVAGDA